MGYFNYFIKCIIRNISYKLFKPKVFFTVLFSICILFGLKHFGYCAEWSDSDIDHVLNSLTSMVNDLTQQLAELRAIDINVSDIETKLNTVSGQLSTISTNTSNSVTQLQSISNELDSLSVQINNLIDQDEQNTEEIKNTIIEENNKSLEKLNAIYDLLHGTTTITDGTFNTISGELHSSGNVISSTWQQTGYFEYNTNYKYKIVFTANYASSTSFRVNISGSSVVPYVGKGTNILQSYSLVGGRTYTYIVDKGLNFKYINFSTFSGMSVVVSVIDEQPGALDGIQDGLDKGNQLQQEQNDFLKQETTDSDVSIDSFNSVDANDITSSGLSGIFTTIYNSINSWSSKDIVLPVPFTNKSLTIPSNYTYNMLSSVGGGLLITIISTVYYFIVARFIIYSITGIINSIKSGSILETDTKTNITTEML